LKIHDIIFPTYIEWHHFGGKKLKIKNLKKKNNMVNVVHKNLDPILAVVPTNTEHVSINLDRQSADVTVLELQKICILFGSLKD
jgi:hypothetical protein